MRFMKYLALQVLALTLLSGCNNALDNKKLTNSKAQGALSKWVGGRGQITVQGIQEIPQENSAKADIHFNQLRVQAKNIFGLPIQGKYTTWSGPGFAVFTRYNDGRWVLTKVQTSQGLDSVWWDNVSIEAN